MYFPRNNAGRKTLSDKAHHVLQQQHFLLAPERWGIDIFADMRGRIIHTSA
jgi:hypothetical protein